MTPLLASLRQRHDLLEPRGGPGTARFVTTGEFRF